MNYFLSSVVLFLLCSFSYGQDCSSIRLTEAGDVQVIVAGPETGECFSFYLNKKLMNSELTSELTFNINAEDFRINDSILVIKARLIMADGEEIKKNMTIPDGYKSHLFFIKKLKKGKYRLKRKRSGMVPTEETLAEQAADKKAFFDEHDRKVAEAKAKSDADDAAWDAERAKKKAEMKERIASDDGAKLSDYEDTAKGKEGANHEVIKGADHQVIKGADHQLIEGADHKLVEGREEQLVQGRDGQLVQGRDEQLVEGRTDNFGSQDDSFGKSAFDDDDEEESDAALERAEILNPNGEEVKMNLRLIYNGEPVASTKLVLEIDNVTLGSGTTDKDGNLLITTSLPINMYKNFRLSGQKGDFKWMFGGLQMLDFPPKTTTIEMAYIIQNISEQMEISPTALSKTWGFLME